VLGGLRQEREDDLVEREDDLVEREDDLVERELHVTEVRFWVKARPHTSAELDAPEGVDDQLAYAEIARWPGADLLDV
jgi:hypothetical protein